MKTIYIFDPNTFEFLYVDAAQECQIEPGKYIMPTASTDIKPPKAEKNHVPIFNPEQKRWAIIEDYRGQDFYDQTTGDPVTISSLGPLPSNIGPELPLAVALPLAKKAKNIEINGLRLAATYNCFTWNKKKFSCDMLSRFDIESVANYIGLHGSLPPSMNGSWKAMDNEFVEIPDVDTFKNMYQALTDHAAANFAHSEALKAELAMVRTLADVKSITW